jgi:hypothetical protein
VKGIPLVSTSQSKLEIDDQSFSLYLLIAGSPAKNLRDKGVELGLSMVIKMVLQSGNTTEALLEDPFTGVAVDVEGLLHLLHGCVKRLFPTH